jgi:ssDNA-binding Zn-finger/Zn-ribbon topoisomerase 1
MATKRALAANGKTAEVVPFPQPVEKSDSFRFTYNVRSETESLTIRTNDEAEFVNLRAIYKQQILPPKKKKPYMLPDDPCASDDCNGYMTVQKGRNRKTQEEYEFLGCSNFPTCEFSAYIAQNSEGS